jgi:hypothetical protein
MRVRVVKELNGFYYVESKTYWFSMWKYRSLSASKEDATRVAKEILSNNNITEVFL